MGRLIHRIAAWRRTPAGIWAEWFGFVAASSVMAASSAAFGWHWIVTGFFAFVAAFYGAFLVLLLSIRNDLGDRDQAESDMANADHAARGVSYRPTDGRDMIASARALSGPEDGADE